MSIDLIKRTLPIGVIVSIYFDDPPEFCAGQVLVEVLIPAARLDQGHRRAFPDNRIGDNHAYRKGHRSPVGGEVNDRRGQSITKQDIATEIPVDKLWWITDRAQSLYGTSDSESSRP